VSVSWIGSVLLLLLLLLFPFFPFRVSRFHCPTPLTDFNA
jgi:hypothetical protein